jgi:hypothetical protein
MGISLYGLTPATTYDALIKTGDNEPLTSALKVLSDGVGTNLPMEASTTGINFTGALQQSGVAVPTAGQVAAKQDTLVSGTNIKTINSTSLLGSGNIAVVTSPSGVAGAIQFSNGSAFASDAANFFWDDTNNRLGVGTNAPAANVHIIGANTLANTFNTKIEGSAGLGIFSIANDGGAQIGDYTGNGYQSSLYFLRPSGATRASRLLQGNADLTLTNPIGGFVMNGLQCTIKGSGSTSATISLLVQNSAGGHLFSVRDDGRLLMGNNNVFGRLYSNIVGADFPSYSFDGNPQVGMFNISTGNFGLSAGGVERVRIGTGGIGINTLASNVASATLQIDSTTQGVLFPRMTTTQKNAIATPAAGLVVYDNTTNKLQCYNGSTWNDLF